MTGRDTTPTRTGGCHAERCHRNGRGWGQPQERLRAAYHRAVSDGERRSRTKGYGVKLVRGPFVRLPAHELACQDEDEMLALAESMEGPLAIDLFCGAGGLSQGLSRAGYNVILGIDHDDEALETHRAHHPGLSVNWDLGDPEVIQRIARLARQAGVSLIAGGPPCQPFSRAGRSMMRDLVRRGQRSSHDRRRDMWESFLQIVEEAQPEAVIMENVPDMALDRGMIILRAMVARLELLGYAVEERVVETWRYGVPQFRQRLILVALADGRAFEWPQEVEERVTVANAIDDLPPVEGGARPNNGDGADPVASGWWPYGGPRSDFQRAARSAVEPAQADRIYDHITRPVREDDARAFAAMSSSTRYSDLDPSLRRYRDDIFDDKYKRLDPNDRSRTITAHIAKDGYWYIHPFEDRTLTVREAARLQTFPDHVRFAGPPSAAFRQIGNAVPPLLGEHLGGAVLAVYQGPSGPRPISSLRIAEDLAAWWADRLPVGVPWLAADLRWQVVQAEVLWSRLAQEQLGRAWMAVRTLTDPERTLRSLSLLRNLARQWGREDRIDGLRQMAEWVADNPEVMSSAATGEDMMRAPDMSKSVVDLATRVVPGETEDPVLAGFGVLRVAARYFGESVDRRNRLSDGRLAIARMIGGGDESHAAHLALIELAASVCLPRVPRCAECPLVDSCTTARTAPLQRRLVITSPTR